VLGFRWGVAGGYPPELLSFDAYGGDGDTFYIYF
jgi:hypothetical protein